jgi:hypothetical protein
MVDPVGKTDAFHDKCVDYQSDLTADDSVGLKFVEFVNKEQMAPAVDVHLVSSLLLTVGGHELVAEVLGTLPVDQEYLHGTLIEVDLAHHGDQLCATNDAEQNVVVFVIEVVLFKRRHEHEDPVLQLEEDEDPACGEEQVPEEELARQVE